MVGWLATTAAATTLSWAGVSLVTSEVTGTHSSLSTGRVAELAVSPVTTSEPTGASTTTTTTTTSTTTTTTPAAAVVVEAAAPTTPTTSVARAPVAEPPPAESPPPIAEEPPAPEPEPAPPPPPPAPPPEVTATYSARGGVATVACQGPAIRLVSARPVDGYRLEVRDDGPERVVVVFLSDTDRSGVGATCVEGAPARQRVHDDGPRHDGPRPPPPDGDR